MTALLVPVQLDALVVRGAEAWAQTQMTVPKPARGRRRRQDLLPDPFTALDPPRPAGAYLHWALPDALTRTRQESGAREVWAVPDRWLVVRLTGDTRAGARGVRAWLLPDVNAQAPAVIDPLAGAALPDPGPAPAKPLTYLGHGDPAWAAYFDNAVGRLALYDDLGGVPSGPLAYLVCGWYRRDPARDDPLAVTSEAALAARLAELAWACDRTTGDPLPTASVFHGAAVAIGWPAASWPGDGGILGAEQDLRPDPAAILAAVGETAAEAIAALTTQDPGDAALTRVVEGLIDGSLPELRAPDGPARLDTALHLSRFGSRPSANADEVIWEPAPAAASPPPADGGDAAGALAASSAAAANGGGGTSAASANGDGDGGVPGNFRTVQRSQPRVWHAVNPEIVLSGAGRSFKHGGDGRFTADGSLLCRLEGRTVTAFGVAGGDAGTGAAVLPADPLGGLQAAYGVPAAVPALLAELASLDPGSAGDLAAATAGAPSPVAAQRARWWALWDPDVDPADALGGASIAGTLPSPVAVTPPTRPWVPLRLEWKADYRPSERGAHDWGLGDVDFELPDDVAVPPADASHALAGRVMLSSAPARALSGAADALTGDAVSGGGADPDSVALLGDAAAAGGGGEPLADTLAAGDLLSGAFEGVIEQLRGDPSGAVVTDAAAGPAEAPAAGGPPPPGFVALRAGFMEPTELRLVDAYGQVIDLLPGLDVHHGPGTAVPGHPELVALRPRFTADARVLLRYTAAEGARVDASPGISPVAGYVVPSPIDGTLELFDDDGARLGRLRPDDVTGTAWEEDPGLPSSLGALPSAFVLNPALGAFADAVLAADTTAAAAGRRGQTALEALLRTIDTTRWTVDVAGRAGDEHLALLLGRPVAVMRATVLLDVQDPHAPPENRSTSVPLKLGTLAHLQDGLLAFAVGDQPTEVRVVDPAVADVGAITSSFVNAAPAIDVNPGIPVPLLLFVVPHSEVHATTGLLPQKSVGMLREWTAPALARISPALRHGPVLHDAKVVRLPVPADVRGTWTWHHRTDPTTWAGDEVVAATADAILSPDPAVVTDGWLSVTLIPDDPYLETAVGVHITHVRSRGSSGRQISAVAGTNPDGTHFLIPVADAAALQDSGRFVFYVQQDARGPRKYARVVKRAGAKFLWTPHDATTRNNLLSLPEAPRDW